MFFWFLALYEYATAEDEHDSLFVDLHYKKGIQASPFRKNMDTYLIVDDGSSNLRYFG